MSKIPIPNVWQRTQQKVIEQSWQFLITGGVLITGMVLSDSDWDLVDGIVNLGGGIVVHASLLWARYYRHFHNAFMHDFAVTNNLQYTAQGTIDGRHGRLFSKYTDGELFNIVSGTILGLPTELYNYTYKIGSGKQKTTYTATVLEVRFNGPVPQFSVLEKRETLDVLEIPRTLQYQHRLAGDFSDHFTLFVSDNEEQEALEILTPEIMAFLIDNGSQFSFEFVENQLFIYQNKYIIDTPELERFLALARLLLERLQKRISRLHDDVEALRAVRDRLSPKKS